MLHLLFLPYLQYTCLHQLTSVLVQEGTAHHFVSLQHVHVIKNVDCTNEVGTRNASQKNACVIKVLGSFILKKSKD